MSVVIECFEAHGDDTGGVPESVTKVTNCNLKNSATPEHHYYMYDLQRPLGTNFGPQASFTFTRTFSFKITGDFPRIKNIRIELPSGLEANWRVNYGLRDTYKAPTQLFNEFGVVNGGYDGTLIPLADAVTLYPKTYQGANLSAPVWTRPLSHIDGTPVWTQFLVLQFVALPSEFNDVENFGLEQIYVHVDEMEI